VSTFLAGLFSTIHEPFHHHRSNHRQWFNFSVPCTNGRVIETGVPLARDDFGVYRGVWDFGEKKATFVVNRMR